MLIVPKGDHQHGWGLWSESRHSRSSPDQHSQNQNLRACASIPMRVSTPFPFGLFMSRGVSATAPTVTEIYLCVQEEVRNPIRGCFRWSAAGRTPKFFIPPPPCFKSCSSGVRNTVYVCGESLIEIWGHGGLGVLHPGIKKGYSRRKFFRFLLPSRRKRRDFFLALRALHVHALRCYPVCGFPLNPAHLI